MSREVDWRPRVRRSGFTPPRVRMLSWEQILVFTAFWLSVLAVLSVTGDFPQQLLQ
ncbi:MAG TPA: hypothetical protein VLX09_21795 [Stellaceae bacterium]|nr:hypothetical protein [Stellaceae bacterium]